jgi:hypothetical protein
MAGYVYVGRWGRLRDDPLRSRDPTRTSAASVGCSPAAKRRNLMDEDPHSHMRSFKASLNKLRAKFHAKRIGPIVKQSPAVFIAACKALNISSVEVAYLKRYLVSIDVNSRSIAHGTLRDGAFQLDLFQRVSAAYAERRTTFINVGANVGTTCLNAHHGGFRKFIAFEPVSNNFRLLTRNLAQIETDSTVSLRQQAVGATAGRTRINLNPQSTGRHSIVRSFEGGS